MPPIVVGPHSLDEWVRYRCRRTLFQLSSPRRDRRGVGPVRLPDRFVQRVVVLNPHSVAASPTLIQIIDRRACRGLEETRYLDSSQRVYCPGEVEDDFLLIDDDCVVRLLHDDHGRLVLGVVQTGGMLDRYRLVRDLVWEAAVPSDWSRDLN